MLEGLKKFKPSFLEHSDQSSGMYKPLFNFRRLWRQSIAVNLAVVLLPLFTLAAVDYVISKRAQESELLLRTARQVSNARRSLTSYLEERTFALYFLTLDNTFDQLANAHRLGQLLEHLRRGLGDWADLGLVDHTGTQVNYAGPYNIKGINYSDQDWYKNLHYNAPDTFQDTKAMHSNVSDIFLGFRMTPHLVISILHNDRSGQHYILRAGLEIERLSGILSQLELGGDGEAFLVNHDGIVQTPTRRYGNIMQAFPFDLPPFSEHTETFERFDHLGRKVIVGYAYITGSPFVLLVIKQKNNLLQAWESFDNQLLIFLVASVFTIVGVVAGICTYLVNSIYHADQKRLASLHQAEYADKMASIGRLSAGVAHEINNPLAIINEKAGLIKDLFTFRQEYAGNSRLLGLVDSIGASVERCATITQQLLNFARNIQVTVQQVNLKEVVGDVLAFQMKNAAANNITISVDIPDSLPEFYSDRGKLQQVFINLVNNAFAAMKGGGRLEIKSRLGGNGLQVITRVKDTGCGIPTEDIEKIFEPFFTTRGGDGGTGLGLSITYGLVTELGGTISIESAVGKGTTFSVALPFQQHTD